MVVFQFIKELINENHSENINENDNQRKSKNKNITADTSVCILARTNQSLKRIANLLMAENIDFYLKDRIDNIFEKDLFKILIVFFIFRIGSRMCGTLVSLYDLLHQPVTHNVFIGKVALCNAVHILQHLQRVHQTAAGAAR